jgi:hypothetical protein
VAGGAFQIRSKKWDIGVIIGSLVLLVVGFGGLFLLQSSGAAGDPVLLFVVFLGILTFCGFSGPGIVYVLRKRNSWVKGKLPGGTMAWIRSHLYIPILALVAAYVHATSVPFRGQMSSGKLLIVLGILVSIAGLARHHLIGVQKAALNVNVAISKISSGQPRAFRRLVADYTDTNRPVQEIDAEMAQFPPEQQERWSKIKALRSEVDKHFPRTGGQTISIRSYKFWRALHPPLTILLFVVLGYHMYDVLGGSTPFDGETTGFAAAQSCAGCHSKTYSEWGISAMSHAQNSTINFAQLPVTLAKNRLLADQGEIPANNQNPDIVVNQDDLFNASAKVCVTCHAPVAAQLAKFNDAMFPLDQEGSVGVKAKGKAFEGGGDVVQKDGISCQVCHGTEKPPAELQAATAPLNSEKESLGGYGSVFAPLFENPNPLPQRIHDIGQGQDNFWNDKIQSTQLCGACHNVKLDLQGDGLALDPNRDPNNPNAPDTTLDGLDTDGAPITDLATAQQHDRNNNLQLDENETDNKHDVVLQTTYDEWQDYVAFFDAPDKGFKDRYSSDNLDSFANPNDTPLACSDCHMPLESKDDPTSGVVDHAPGLLSIPQREYHTHTFVGVDYDLNPDRYEGEGLPPNAEDKVLAEREALMRSAVTLKVAPGLAPTPLTLDGVAGNVVTFDVTVRNNLLAHTFPTGFAFARQFWLEVGAETDSGDPVCLVPPLGLVTADGSLAVNTPCVSGAIGVDAKTKPEDALKKLKDGPSADDTTQDLLQCDAKAISDEVPAPVYDNPINNADKSIPNTNIEFAFSAPPDNCDPWLTNFQKILTDGEPNLDGVKKEVSFQNFLPDLVQFRGRPATGDIMADLQPVRLDPTTLDERQSATVSYQFFVPDSLNIKSVDDIKVTATMRARHLPPYFVRALAKEQQDILGQGFNVPDGARIFDDDAHPNRTEFLIGHETITEVGTANSKDGTETLGCDQGAQNVAGGTILDCVNDTFTPQFTVKGPEFAKDNGNALPAGHPSLENAGALGGSGSRALVSTMALALVVPFGWWRVRRRRRRAAPLHAHP